MILKSSEIVKKFDKKIFFYLLYGQNSAQIEESIEQIFKPKLSKNIFIYDESEIISQIDLFKEEISTKSFFENDKLIIINRGSDKILELVKSLQEKIYDTVIIIKSGILEKKSKLRIFFEKNKDTICVPFYNDDLQTLIKLAKEFFFYNKIKISAQNINYIVEKSVNNRSNLKNELEKIKTFYGRKKSIEFNDILNLTNSSTDYSASELVDQFLSGNKKKTINIINENLSNDENIILTLRTLLYKLKRLKKLKTIIIKKNNVEEAISYYKPPIFWKDKNIVKQQLTNWSLTEINIFINRINNLETMVKKNNQISNLILNNFILENLKKSKNFL